MRFFGTGISLGRGRGRVEEIEAIPLGPAHAPIGGAVDGGAGEVFMGAALELFFLLAKAQFLLQRVRCSGVNDPAMFGGTTNLEPRDEAGVELTLVDIARTAEAAAGDRSVPWIFR